MTYSLFAIDLPHNVGSSLEELEGSHKFMRLARAAIEHLEPLANLTEMDLRGTTVSADGIEALRSALPECKVQHESKND